MYFTKDVRPNRVPEHMNPKTKTETVGALTLLQRIENVIAAGQRLTDYRRERYDLAPGEPAEKAQIDPTRAKSFGFAEAADLEKRLVNNAKTRAEEEDEKKQHKLFEEEEKPEIEENTEDD
jgi:hypothetical protein